MMAATGDLRSLLGPATFNQIPSHAAGVLQELWTKTSDNLRLKEEKVCTVRMLGLVNKNSVKNDKLNESVWWGQSIEYTFELTLSISTFAFGLRSAKIYFNCSQMWFCLKFHLWSQVRVEGEQKVAELQAVVEELNGKLGTFTQVS